MWKRKELKKSAKEVISKNYWTAMVVCFLIALLTGEFGTSILGVWQSEDSMDPNYIEHRQSLIMNNKTEIKLTDTQEQIFKLIEANLNSVTKSQKYIFKIWDAAKSFSMQETEPGIKLCISALLGFTFIIFIANPITVGGKKYFLKAREGNKTKIGIIGDMFKAGKLLNVSIIMLLRYIYNALWYLTVIGGIIKNYEYRMIPYILAEKPEIKRKEAFKLSKQMMKGNKWKTFILDISFIGWNFLSVLTLGVLNILYVNPYKAATNAELYVVLRNKAITEKYQYYENLNDKSFAK